MGATEIHFGNAERAAAARLIELALAEDLGHAGDLTCRALVDSAERATVAVVARQAGILAGAPVAQLVFKTIDPEIEWHQSTADGTRLEAGTVIATVSGPLRSLLTAERTALNFLTHLSGVATLTRRFVDAAAGTRASILDTRKTLPGYRSLEKYAVRAGGGTNHRMGLYDGVLIKDNHLAAWTAAGKPISQAVAEARRVLEPGLPVEVEVDTLEQLRDALKTRPDVVLLDNMNLATLRQAVAERDASAAGVLLEASGGVTLETVRAIAETGVDRISVGVLTHSAPAVDIALDWRRPLSRASR
jgi:nicotinate-nucleotide pyrophosphorylase (carboxylating)